MKKLLIKLSVIIGMTFTNTTLIVAQNTSPWPATGRVGLGTINPATLLEVNRGAIRLTNPDEFPYGINIDVNYTTSWAREFIVSYNKSNKMLAMGVYGNGSTLNYSYIGGNTTLDDAYLYPWMMFTPTGNVGIGTTKPGNFKLAVEGTLGARQIKVQQKAWADFVFHKDYELPSLQYVENFIRENKHLPGIPSEEQVKEEGLDIGDINKKLLQKVEELTLYIIEMKKDIERLKGGKK